METLQQLYEVHWDRWGANTVNILIVIAVALITMRTAKAALKRFENRLIRRGDAKGDVPSESLKRAETLVRLLRQGVLVFLWVVTGMIILREVGVEIAPILASAGIVGVALGFGAQNLVRDVIAGFFMILEDQVRVGDVAVVNGTGGLVEQMNFRTIVLRDLSGVVHIFPNGAVTTLANRTHEWSAYVLDISVAYKEDVDRVMAIMREVATEMRTSSELAPFILDDIEMFGVDQFAESAVVLKARIKTVPIKQWDVGREYLRRLKQAFDREHIEIPFPHRTLYFGEASKPFAAHVQSAAAAPARA